MGRQVTEAELFDDLLKACAGHEVCADAALKVVVQHVLDGDRIKISSPPELTSTDNSFYRVGDPDPTPDKPPYCGARFGHPVGGPWCGWPPNHDSDHVAADGQVILAVFPWGDEAGWHPMSGKTPEQLGLIETPEEIAPPSDSPGTISEHLADPPDGGVSNASNISDQELAHQVKTMSQVLIALAERLEQ